MPTRREFMPLSTPVKNVIRLSIPAILAELSSTLMQYIDASMVGSLGKVASASIGLVASSTWLINGIGMACATGFAVQVAQKIGADQKGQARTIVSSARKASFLLSIFMVASGIALSKPLPILLQGDAPVRIGASQYFFVFACSLLFVYSRQLSSMILQCAGDMKTPSKLNIYLCGLDILFNAFFIFFLRLGVLGAALGTACSEILISVWMFKAVDFHFEGIHKEKESGAKIQKTALRIGLPIALEKSIVNLAQILLIRIISPLGTVSIAANSLAVSAESLCYMPGFGIGNAATTLVGQSIGARQPEQAKQYAYTATLLGIGFMSFMGVLMFIGAPLIFRMLTNDPEVQALGAQVLRIEAFAEPFFASSIVIAGALRGIGDTLVPSLYNLISMWGVRIVLSFLLASRFGLPGVWSAMAIELVVRGILFIVRLFRKDWKNSSLFEAEKEGPHLDSSRS